MNILDKFFISLMRLIMEYRSFAIGISVLHVLVLVMWFTVGFWVFVAHAAWSVWVILMSKRHHWNLLAIEHQLRKENKLWTK